MSLSAKIIERDTIPRYNASLNTLIPTIGAIWYDPKKAYTLKVSDGVLELKEPITKGRAEVRFQGHAISLAINKDPNAKGMYDFKIVTVKIAKDKPENNLTPGKEPGRIIPVSQRDSLGANSDLAKNANKSKEA